MRRFARRATAAAWFAALSLGLAACGSNGTPAPDRTDGTSRAAAASRVEVFTWWASGSEKLGLDALVGVFAQQHPSTTFVNGAVAGGAGSVAKDLLRSRLDAGDPPDTFQAHAGAELSDYIAAGELQDVSVLYDELNLRNVFPKELISQLTVDGKIYSVPSNIHRANMVWANPSVLTSAGLDPEATYDSLASWFVALDAVRASGTTALSVATTWTQVNLLETVLISELGPDGYAGLWDGRTDWTSAQVTGSLKDFERLMSYTNTDRDSLDWSDATQRVIDGTSAFTVMGDWAVAAFHEAGKAPGTGFTCFPVPGTAGVFDYLADSFTLPVGAPHPDGAKAWLETVASSSGQAAFSKAKGSIPARTDFNPADFSEYQQSAIASFRTDTIVPSLAHGAAAPIAVLDAISEATRSFTTGKTDLASFQTQLAAAATK